MRAAILVGIWSALVLAIVWLGARRARRRAARRRSILDPLEAGRRAA